MTSTSLQRIDARRSVRGPIGNADACLVNIHGSDHTSAASNADSHALAPNREKVLCAVRKTSASTPQEPEQVGSCEQVLKTVRHILHGAGFAKLVLSKTFSFAEFALSCEPEIRGSGGVGTQSPRCLPGRINEY